MEEKQNNQEQVVYPSFIDIKYLWQEFKKSKNGYNNSHLYIKNVNQHKGLGVFPNQNIKEGQIVEFCHCVKIDTPKQWIHDRGLLKYCYWTNYGQGVMPLGYGPIYNSADRQHLRNTDFFIFPEDNLIVFVAQKNITAHEEILVWWGDSYYENWCKPSNPKGIIKD